MRGRPAKRPAALWALIWRCAIFFSVAALPFDALAGEYAPFHSRNQNPFVQIFGLPVAESGLITPPGEWRSDAFVDLSNSFSGGTAGGEFISIDGETLRLTILLRYGVSENLEVGAEVPIVHHGGGMLDAMISDFHRTFGMSSAGRNLVARNRIDYRYAANGNNRINLNRTVMGLGDIQLPALTGSGGRAMRGRWLCGWG